MCLSELRKFILKRKSLVFAFWNLILYIIRAMNNVQIRFLSAYCNFVLYSSWYRVIVSGINWAISWNSSYLYTSLHNENVLSSVRKPDSCSNVFVYSVLGVVISSAYLRHQRELHYFTLLWQSLRKISRNLYTIAR